MKLTRVFLSVALLLALPLAAETRHVAPALDAGGGGGFENIETGTFIRDVVQ